MQRLTACFLAILLIVTVYRPQTYAAIDSKRSNRTTPAGRLEGKFNLYKGGSIVPMLILVTLLPDATCGSQSVICPSARFPHY